MLFFKEINLLKTSTLVHGTPKDVITK